jgi:hypothetical protein
VGVVFLDRVATDEPAGDSVTALRTISVPPTKLGLNRIAYAAHRWGEAWFYRDELRVLVSTIQIAELEDDLILHFFGKVPTDEIRKMLEMEVE